MPVHPLSGAAKAWVALIGAVATALLGVYAADSAVGQLLTVVAVLSTAIGTYTARNTPSHDSPPPAAVEGTH